MELKNLLTKLKPKEETPEYFFALEIDDDFVKSAVWTVIEGQTKIVKLGSTETWDGTKPEDLLTAVDQSISAASENIAPEPSGTIFGLPKSWVDKDAISQDKKQLLKTVCQQLKLKPLGFVVTSTAIIQYLRIQEGTPPSAIFLQIESGELNLVLVKLGKIIGTELVGRSHDLGADVEEGLSRFDSIDSLPSRMILFDGQVDFGEAKQQLISYDWQEKLPFIHFPKVEVLAGDASIKAVALAGGSEVAKSLGFEIKPPPKTEPPPVEASATDLGFIANQDVAAAIVSAPTLVASPPESPAPETHSLNQFFSSASRFFSPKISSLRQRFLVRSDRKIPNFLTILAVGFVLLSVAVFAAYWYLPKATVILVVEPKTLEEELTLTIDSQATNLDVESAVLPGEPLEISVTGQKTISTTGKALIGDPAKGEITIFNKTDQTKTFAAGTILIGPGNLAFTLDEDTTVASQSSQEKEAGTETIWGQAQASITAKSIGPEGNLAAGSKLSFKQFPSDKFSAKTSIGLSGGSAREVKAVSQADQDNLLTALAEELKAKAQEQVNQQIGSGATLVDVDVKDQLISKQFNHDVGEEADRLKLEAKLEYTALSFKQDDLNLLLNQAIKEKIPPGFQLSDASEINMKPAQLKPNGTAVIQVAFKAKLIPQLDFAAIKQNLVGRYPRITQEYLAGLPNFVRADIKITPNLPQKLKTLPRVAKNITIEIQTQD